MTRGSGIQCGDMLVKRHVNRIGVRVFGNTRPAIARPAAARRQEQDLRTQNRLRRGNEGKMRDAFKDAPLPYLLPVECQGTGSYPPGLQG